MFPTWSEALLLLADNDRAVGEVVNIGNPRKSPLRTWLGESLRLPAPAWVFSTFPTRRRMKQGFEDMERRVPDIRKLASMTGFLPGSASTALAAHTSRGSGRKRRLRRPGDACGLLRGLDERHRTARSTRADHLQELSGSAQSSVPDPVHQLHLQPEMRALLLLAKPQPPRRPDHGRDLRAFAIAGADRKPESVRRRAVPPPGIRRDLPPVHPANKVRQIYVPTNGYFTESHRQADHRDARRRRTSICSWPKSRSTVWASSTTSSAVRRARSIRRWRPTMRWPELQAQRSPAADSRDLDRDGVNMDEIRRLTTYLCRSLPENGPSQSGDDPRRPQESVAAGAQRSSRYQRLYEYVRRLWASRKTAVTARWSSRCCNGPSRGPPRGKRR